MEKLAFKEMSSRFKEHRNFLKLASVLVDYGYMCSWLPVDDKGADFIAVHCKTNDVLKIQLKGRISVNKKYFGKALYMAFPLDSHRPLENWVIVSHDTIIPLFISEKSWANNQGRVSPKVPLKIQQEIRNLSIVKPITFSKV